MRSFIKLCLTLSVAVGATYATPAAAQATRTWVSGVGDDLNPCSRTAPCKTFAGAISKTAPGGEINCLDPGGFGAVAINKALTIDCHYTEGGLLAGGNGIVVNAGPTDAVFLRGLDIFGVNPPTHGVRFIAGGTLHIEDSVIRRFNSASSFGVSFQPGATSFLYISNTTIAENGNGATGGGILIQPTGASGGARFQLNNVRIQNNANNGLRIDTTSNPSAVGVKGTIENSQIDQNTNGIAMVTPAGGADARLSVNHVTVSNNSVGLLANGNFAKMFVGNSTIFNNATGISIAGGATINTYGNNTVAENPIPGAFTLPVLPSN
jgi:hypothetical protein